MDTVLIPIDVQRGFDDPIWGPRNNPEFEAHVTEALATFRAEGLPVWHVHHHSLDPRSPLRPGQPGAEAFPYAAPRPGERLYRKHVNSAFIGTSLAQDLAAAGLRHLVLCGLTSDHCVSTTARMGANLGFEVTVLHDATATHDRFDVECNRLPASRVHQVALASLKGEFAHVVSTRSLEDRITRRPAHAHV